LYATHSNITILEPLSESAEDKFLVLLLYDIWSGGEDAESRLSLAWVFRLTACQQCLEQLWPLFA
jgi:hypothetical protein